MELKWLWWEHGLGGSEDWGEQAQMLFPCARQSHQAQRERHSSALSEGAKEAGQAQGEVGYTGAKLEVSVLCWGCAASCQDQMMPPAP